MTPGEDAIDWSTRPKAGWTEFSALRAGFLDRLQAQSEVRRLEGAWRAASRPGRARRLPAAGGRATAS